MGWVVGNPQDRKRGFAGEEVPLKKEKEKKNCSEIKPNQEVRINARLRFFTYAIFALPALPSFSRCTLHAVATHASTLAAPRGGLPLFFPLEFTPGPGFGCGFGCGFVGVANMADESVHGWWPGLGVFGDKTPSLLFESVRRGVSGDLEDRLALAGTGMAAFLDLRFLVVEASSS